MGNVSFGVKYLDESYQGVPDDGTEALYNIMGATTFSIIFSPTGQLTIKDVVVRPKNCYDKIINHSGRVTLPKTDARSALLYCDGYFPDSAEEDEELNDTSYFSKPWCYDEASTVGLYFYEVGAMGEVRADLRYSEFINRHVGNNSVERMMINIYTGGVIEEER